jgi:hypothetical protein
MDTLLVLDVSNIQIAFLPIAILGAAIIGGAFAFIGARENAKEAKAAHDEDLELAKNQFLWGQKTETFDMQNKAVDQARTQVNDSLATGFAMKDRAAASMAARSPTAAQPLNRVYGGNQ